MTNKRCLLAARARRGLTLVELVVVLAIVVMLAGAAISATEGALEEARYDTTQRTLASIEDAVLGPFDQQGPAIQPARPWASGFVSDMGRLPRVPTAVVATPEMMLQELWTLPENATPFGVHAPAGDPELRIACGWRGPYLRLGFGEPRLFDGWGRAFTCAKSDGTVVQPGDQITQLLTLGADNAIGGANYDADLRSAIHATNVTPVIGPRHTGAIPIRVTPANTGTVTLIVRLYGPTEDGAPRTLGQRVFVAAAGAQTHTFPDISIGRRVVRAYETTETDLTAVTLEAELGSGGTSVVPITRISRPINVDLPRGGVSEIEIVWP